MLIYPNPFLLVYSDEELAELSQSIAENGLIQYCPKMDIIGYDPTGEKERLRACKRHRMFRKEEVWIKSRKQAIIENLQQPVSIYWRSKGLS